MKLKKSKKLAQDQIEKIFINIKELVEGLEDVYDNKQLEEKLKKIKNSSLEIIDYFIDNCADQTTKIKGMNKRNYPKRKSFEEVINNEINNEKDD